MASHSTTDQNPAYLDPSMRDFLRTATYVSLFPMIILMPCWIAFGRGFFGAGGWLVFMTLPLAVIVIFPYHILITILAFLGRKSKLSMRSVALLLGYYLFTIGAELSVVDGGDTQESVGSVLTFSGVPEILNTTIFVLSCLGGIAAMIGIVVSLTKDIVKRRRKIPTR